MALDYIDTSVFLGKILRDREDCRDYLNTVGYKYKNLGLISHFVVSEAVVNLFFKMESGVLREIAFDTFYDNFEHYFEQDKISLVKLSEEIDFDILNELREVDHALTFDDALHLCVAVQNGCKLFVTLDEGLSNNEVLRKHVKDEFGLKIKNLSG